MQLLQNVIIGTDDQNLENYSFVLGRLMSDGKWEIIGAAKRGDDGGWHEVALKRKDEIGPVVGLTGASVGDGS